MRFRIAAGVLAWTLSLPSVALAGWGVDGARVSNFSTPSEPGDNGRAVVAGGYAIWAGGTPLHVNFANITDGPSGTYPATAICPGNCGIGSTQKEPVAVLGDDGVLYVAWLNSVGAPGCVTTCFDVYAAAIWTCNSVATLQTTQVSSSSTSATTKLGLGICKLKGGGALVVWEEPGGILPGAPRNLIASFLSPNQSCGLDTASFWVAPSSGTQTDPAAVATNDGGAIFVWSETRPPSTVHAIYGQQVDPSGRGEWGPPNSDGFPIGVPICQDGDSEEPAITTDGLGGAIIAWSEIGSRGDRDVFATCVCPGPTPSTARYRWDSPSCKTVCTDPSEQGSPVIVSDGINGAIIAWQDARSSSLADPQYDVYAQRLDSNGSPPPTWPPDGKLVSSGTSACSKYRPSISTDNLSGAVVAWYDCSADIYSQRIGSRGQLGASPSLICDTPSPPAYTQDWPGIGFIPADGSFVDGSIVAWHDERSGPDLWATRRDLPELVAVDFGTPSSFEIRAWPNPFHQSIALRLMLPEPDDVVLEVFDLLGRRVRTIARGRFDAGSHVFEWSGSTERGAQGSTGIYFLRGRIGGRMVRRQLVLIR